MLPKEQITEIFTQHPTAKELFQDCNGQVWVDKTTAEFQSVKSGGKITVLKRKDFVTQKK
jgi:hypothetical protein